PFSHILYAKDFYEAWKYVPFLLIANVLNCASGLLGPILSAKKDSKSMMWSAIIGALVNVIMSVVLVYKIGVQGATIATVICSYVIYVVRKRAVGKDIFIKHYHIVVESWGLLFVQAI
ncbi:TPA: polysaccharide biosynthesis C-terminal domain-containing protein, partial [Enterococcus faecium]|nr:polysaccharide biosynthesis C-terminal domain-containing protein [Enterococcus faecium]